jgi:hypothetical protein
MCEPGEVCLYTFDKEFEIEILTVVCVYYFVTLNVTGGQAGGTGVQHHRQWTLPRICTSYWRQVGLPGRRNRPVL